MKLLGEALGVGGGDQDAVGAVVDDVAVAGDVGGDDRRAGRERLDQHHPEALAAERRRAEDVGLMKAAPQLVLGEPAAGLDRLGHLGVGDVGLELLFVDPDDDETHGHVVVERRERAEQRRQALALLGPADEHDPQAVVVGLGAGRGGVEIDPVGDDSVVAAEEAPPRPGRGLGDRDAGVEVVEAAPRAGEVAEPVRDQLRRVGVEGADDGSVRVGACVPADQRRDRLVDVDDVEVAAAKLVAHPRDARPGTRTAAKPSRWPRSRSCARAGPGSRGHRAPRRAHGAAAG